ncbi:hypothetical protein [Rhizosaccharibacter radicis]|uniref:Head decoration protein n=1 Tax=Rhizosaccharibacter radicis TaxID=2782605 RepID=A0ABT1VVZ0_9PROT|nr:hypothetical protein [Acetobacteraceae bacterium KSS12]
MDDGSTGTAPLSSIPDYATSAQFTTLRAGVLSYQDDTPALNGTVTMGFGVAVELLHGTSTIGAVTVRLPPTPVDGQVDRISSQMLVTVLTVQDASGASVAQLALGVFGVGSVFQFRTGAWTRIG